MKKLLAAPFVALALVATGLVTTAASAYSASATDVNFTSTSCFNSSITVTGLDSSEDGGVAIYVYEPDGAIEDERFSHEESSDVFDTLLCEGIDLTGTYRVVVDQTQVATFTVAAPALTVRTVHAHTKRAAVVAQLSLRGQGLGGRLKVEKHEHGSWLPARHVTTSATGVALVRCARRGNPKSCRGLYRLTYNDVSTSRAFHLPRRHR